MSAENNSNQACGSIPPNAKDFQSNMKDLLTEMGASQQCKTSADSFFDSGSSSSGSNLQSGSSSNKMNSSMDTSLDGQTTSVFVEGPKVDSLVFSASTGKIDTKNTYSTSKTSTDLSTEQKTSQLNLTEQQADAFSKGAKTMASEGCGTVVLNATKISNIKQQMSCVVKKSMTSSNKNVKAGASINIRQKEFNLDQCLVRANENANLTTEDERNKARKGCYQIAETQMKSYIDLTGANLRQKVALTLKDSIQLSSDSKTELSNLQKEIANNVIESKLTSDNKLDALPQSAKDIMSRDEKR